MSLGIPSSPALDDMVESAVQDYNIPVIVSAGNNGHEDGCYKSPRSSPYAFVVSATDEGDRHDRIASYGACVRVYAPGRNIFSTVPGVFEDGTPRYQPRSGTSFATPHVTGVAISWLSQVGRPNGLGAEITKPAALYAQIIARATDHAVDNPKPKTTTRLLYALSDDRWKAPPPFGKAGQKPPPPPQSRSQPSLKWQDPTQARSLLVRRPLSESATGVAGESDHTMESSHLDTHEGTRQGASTSIRQNFQGV